MNGNGNGSRDQPGSNPSPGAPGVANTTGEVTVEITRQESGEQLGQYLPGEVIADRYRLERELGRGGMGVVWVAHALALEVDVAVKLINAKEAGKAVAARMAREAHAAAMLGHSALVRVFDFGWTSRADPFLVMELVQGQTLSTLLGEGAIIEPIRAVRMLLPIVDGLRLAHEHAIIHRDIKPENILISTDALGRIQPKLLDFGIAKVGIADTDLRLTQVGVALGSPEYMSPEQAQGIADIDERTDVWSLAVVLYEMTTGNVPFERENYNALLQSIICDPLGPMPTDSGLDQGFWEIIERGLRKDRELRWRSMADFGSALAFWLYEQGSREDISGNSIRAVWLDSAISATERDPVAAAAELTQPLSRRNSASPSWSRMPTTKAVALKRRTQGRSPFEFRSPVATAMMLVCGLLFLALAATKLFAEDDAEHSVEALSLSRRDFALARSVRAQVDSASRRLADSLQSASILAHHPSNLPTNPASVQGRSLSKSSRGSNKLPRDFGF